VIDRYFFSFGFESESVVLPMEFSSIGTRRSSGTRDDTTHGAPFRRSVVVVVVISRPRPRPRLRLIFHPLTRRLSFAYRRASSSSSFNVRRGVRFHTFHSYFCTSRKTCLDELTTARRRRRCGRTTEELPALMV
jgi:hypothetical protein